MFEPTLYTSQLSPSSVFQHALALHKEKENRSSINLILDYLSCSPDSTFLSRVLSYLYAEIYDYDKAFDWIDKALSLDPSNSESYSQQGFLYNRLQQLSLAHSSYTSAIRINPTSCLANCGLAFIYKSYNQIDLSIQYLSRAQAFSPPKESISVLLARALIDANDYYGALAQLNLILSQNLASFRTYEVLGDLHLCLDNTDVAQQMFDQALQERPHSVRAKVGLARICVRNNLFDEAETLISELNK